jgi:asparagine synthase (glutamine-hydrolysing)
MFGICGIFRRNAVIASQELIDSFTRSMSSLCYGGLTVYSDKSVLLGQAVTKDIGPSSAEAGPFSCNDIGAIFTVSARLDNRNEVASSLGIPIGERHSASDNELVKSAYLRWGEDACTRMYGQWSFAVWHPNERKLFVARDHFGETALYYYVDENIFVFSHSRQSILNLGLSPVVIDELFLAQILVSSTDCHGERTAHTAIRRLPPAHTAIITPHNYVVSQYWYLENAPLLYLVKRNDYIDKFNEVFEEAVRSSLYLPSSDESHKNIAIALSSGLDSSAVAVTAGRILHEKDKRLKAYTSVPLNLSKLELEQSYIYDESPYAALTSQFAGNIDHYTLTSAEITPIQAIRRILEIVCEPMHAAGNLFWILKLYSSAVENGWNVLLTGQAGNSGISWNGAISSQSVYFQLQQLGVRRFLKKRIKSILPAWSLKMLKAYRSQNLNDWCQLSAIHPDFAKRVQIQELVYEQQVKNLLRTPLEHRYNILKPGKQIGGSLQANLAAEYGIDLRDPTADVRVLEYMYSIPDHIFINPKTAQYRWIIRESMKGRMPEEVRLNRKFGVQAADLVTRLRLSAAEVDATLHELTIGPSSAYIDVLYMKMVWQQILTEDSMETYSKSISILTRGIMAGLFVNHFYE